MNTFNKKVLLALALCGSVGSAFGYSWNFTNITDKTLVVQVILQAWYNVDTGLGVYFNVVRPGRKADFSWGLGNPRAGHCIDSIRVAVLDKGIAGNQYNNIANNQGMDNRDVQKLLLQHPLREINIEWLDNKTWNEYDEKARKAAAKLATAVGDITAAIATQAAEAAGSKGLDFKSMLSGLGTIVEESMGLMSKSKCVSRDFDVVMEKDKSLKLVTQMK